MEAPEGIVQDLQAVRPTFRLVWNERARVVGERSFDVNGEARVKSYEPRWELWDTDAEGVPYKVLTLEEHYYGRFLPADQRLVELVRLIDPARYGGSVERMVEALVDNENELARELNERDFERLVDALASYYTPAKGDSMVTVL